MNIDDFKSLEDRIQGLPIPASPANIALARSFVLTKWRERAKEMGRPSPKDLSDSCKFTSQFARIIFGGELAGNQKHQFVRLDNGDILDLNFYADDVQKKIKDPHRHDPSFFGNPEHEESMASCRGRVMEWIREFIQILKQRHILGEEAQTDQFWNMARDIRSQIRVPDRKRLAGQCNWAAEELAKKMARQGIQGELVRGYYGSHIHAWVESQGYVIDPTVEQFMSQRQFISRIGELPYHGVERKTFGIRMERLDLRESDSTKEGLYVGVKFSPSTVQNLIDWSKANGIQNKEPDRYHTTVILSKTRKFPYDPIRWNPPLVVLPNTFKFDLFFSHARNANDVLVLCYDCAELDARHWLARVENKLTWDFPEYAPHISLMSLDTPFQGNINDLSPITFPLEIVSEYVKDFE